MLPTILLCIYGLVLIIIALASLRYTTNIDNFLVAGRSQKKIFVVASMLASTIGGGLTIGTAGKAFTMGFPAFWFVASGAIAHFLQGAFLSEKVRKTEALTLPDMATKLVSKPTGNLISIIIMITWVGIATSQFVAAATIISGITGLSHKIAVLCAAVFLIIYTLIGGQKSVLRTDLFQFGFLAIALIATLIWLYVAKTPAPGTIKIELFNNQFTFTDLLYNVIVLGGSYFVCPMMFSRILSADSAKNAKKSSFMSGIGMTIFALLVTFIGLWAKASYNDIGGMDPLNFLANKALPPVLGLLVIFGLLAAILSTGDTVLLTAAGVFEHDILKKNSVKGVRIWTIVIGIIATCIAIFNTDIIGILIKTYNGYTAGIVPALTVAIICSKKRLEPKLTFFAVLIGYILGTIGSFIPSSSIWSKLFPMIGLIVSLSLSLIAANQKSKTATI